MTPYATRLTPLTKRMAEDMLVRNLAERTIDTYTYHVDAFLRQAARPAEELGPEDMRRYQLHLIRKRKVGWSSFNQAVSNVPDRHVPGELQHVAGERPGIRPPGIGETRLDLSAANRTPGSNGASYRLTRCRRRGDRRLRVVPSPAATG